MVKAKYTVNRAEDIEAQVEQVQVETVNQEEVNSENVSIRCQVCQLIFAAVVGVCFIIFLVYEYAIVPYQMNNSTTSTSNGIRRNVVLDGYLNESMVTAATTMPTTTEGELTTFMTVYPVDFPYTTFPQTPYEQACYEPSPINWLNNNFLCNLCDVNWNRFADKITNKTFELASCRHNCFDNLERRVCAVAARDYLAAASKLYAYYDFIPTLCADLCEYSFKQVTDFIWY